MTLPLILVIAFCLLAAGFFAGSETAITSANRAAIHQLAAKGDKKAIFAQTLLNRIDLVLGTTLVGTNFMHVAATSLGSIVIHSGFVTYCDGGSNQWETIATTVVMTPLILVLGELVPKSLARRYADRWVPVIARPLKMTQVVFSPVVYGAAGFAAFLGRLFGLDDTVSHGRLTREDVHAITELAREEGVVPEAAVLMMQTVLGLGETPVSTVMRPLVDMVALPVDSTVGDLEDLIVEHRFGRYPVYEDRIDNIIGLVDARQVVYGAPLDDSRGGKLARAAALEPFIDHEMFFVPESKAVGELLRELHYHRSPMAAVVDEHGGVTGIVTAEDLIEEVVGEILDERDEAAPELKKTGVSTWECDGRYEARQLADDLDYPFAEGDYSTLAGLVLDVAGKIPRAGDRFEFGPFDLTIMRMDKRRIARVEIRSRRASEKMAAPEADG
ncbi:MAG: hemolysin family protein [Lentisphaeria bacterium]|nr:hemolysin family protein [Lentisphaeria bacterium]